MTQRLDRDYPLWEYWLVEGLDRGRWALISKVHHCMVDGVSGTDLYRVIFDTSPEPSPPAVEHGTVSAEPSDLALAAGAAVEAALIPLRESHALYARWPARRVPPGRPSTRGGVCARWPSLYGRRLRPP